MLWLAEQGLVPLFAFVSLISLIIFVVIEIYDEIDLFKCGDDSMNKKVKKVCLSVGKSIGRTLSGNIVASALLAKAFC